jgi:hypothetical protein
MKSQLRMQLVLAMCACLAATTAGSADYAVTWWATAGGGGTSTAGNYVISGTVGQPDTGCSTGGSYTVEGGFWCIVADGPPLGISRSGKSVIVSWPLPATGWVLEQTPTLTGNPAPWTLVPVSQYQTNATHVFLVLSNPVGSKFYRLRSGP